MTSSHRRRINAITLSVFALCVLACGAFVIGNSISGDDPEPVVSLSADPARVAYVERLRSIDPGLVVNEARAIRRAEETCADIAGGLTGDALVKRVVERLSGGNATIDVKQAAAAIALMREHICT